MKRIEEIVRLVENGEVDKALALVPDIKKNGSDEEKYELADYLYSWGMLEEAKELLEELSLRYPDEGEVRLFLAEVYTELEEEEKALEILEQIDEDDPLFARACLIAADLYQMQGLEEVSERKLQQAYEKMPDEPIIQFALAELYFSMGQYPKSIPFYEKVLKKEKTIAGTHIPERLAEALSLCGEFEQALPYYDEALQEKIDSRTLFGYGFTAFQAEYYRTAIEKLSELKELDPEYVPLYLYLAKAYEQEGQLEKSYEIAKEGIHVDEWNKELLLYAGKVALKLKKPDEAESWLRKAIEIDQGYIEALTTLCALLLHQERYEEVVSCLEEAMKQGEYDPQFEWDLARAKHKLEMYSDALNHYREAYTFFKDNVDFLEEYGYFLIEEGNRERAKEIFQQIVRLDPGHIEAADILLQLEE
ncbi:tetratricopeptide repeat protein [Parageobacillus toebii NBRC 107807]|uniref:Tetratricopeptide (TPR) repeat protein n=1 Tax=Parageobacillus toebii NBRC 107807 TaxID=1223503 RepID=A0A6G9J708_9BACL|nr:tetratricopeptide repeat protein [Parageobacillus toebii]MBB3867199.1 tetratricopeptide (TPR) repeat protein [Parageobacillus toebii NBRC 107807]QIQ33969.1 tetratricopeptide repeat protein [Parageobacillus toebii NBRC 107807]QSB50292.1 tetratricopeptide repeat protein [Parageobacillus toebii]